MLQDLDGQRVTVMGLGRFGGGLGVTRWLAQQGATVLVTDKDSADQLAAPIAQVDDLIRDGSVTLRLGEHNVSDFTTCDLVVANPAVPQPWDNRFLRSAHAAGVPITTEIRLLIERLQASAAENTIGVTGSAGKSTTASMIHHLLNANGVRSHLGGNIGGSLLTSLESIGGDDWIVLELSSAMLYWLGKGVGYPDAQGWSPRIAVLTNIAPNHIDWHGSFEHYRESKLNIFRWQPDPPHGISLRSDDEVGDASPIDLSIPGEHNQRNARLAIKTAHLAAGVSRSKLVAAARSFAGLPHRLQLVHEHDGMRFYNDSKSTTPEATLLAVASFEDPQRVHLIAGGYNKKIDLSAIAQLSNRIGGLYAIGATGRELVETGAREGGAVFHCEALENAVAHALQRMKPQDVLVLSPGCASWDQFTNFEQRGDAFARLVRSLACSTAEDVITPST